MISQTQKQITVAYDITAHEYATRYFDELDYKPVDRKLLDLFAERIVSPGKVAEIGCGPGEVARYLKNRGVDILGIDISLNMVAEARRLNPDIEFEQGEVVTRSPYKDVEYQSHRAYIFAYKPKK